jgi:hypothetical protein
MRQNSYLLLLALLSASCTSSFAGYSGLLAPAKKFRVVLEGRSVHRDVKGHLFGYPGNDTVNVSYPLLRFQYGLSDRLRLSGDLFWFRKVEDNEQGDRMLKDFSVVGLSLQGEVWRWRRNMPLDVTAGYWETHTYQYDFIFPNTVRTERMLSLTLARELNRDPANRLYVGGLYTHLRKEGFGYDLNNSSGLASHLDFGVIGGFNARLDQLVLGGEASWTGDYSISGGVGWEF